MPAYRSRNSSTNPGQCRHGGRRGGNFIGFAHVDGLGGFDAEGNLHAVDAVHGGVTGWGAAQRGDAGVGDEAHMHQVVLHGFRKVQRDQDCALADL